MFKNAGPPSEPSSETVVAMQLGVGPNVPAVLVAAQHHESGRAHVGEVAYCPVARVMDDKPGAAHS